MSPKFALTHDLWLGSSMIPSPKTGKPGYCHYNFGSTVVRETVVGSGANATPVTNMMLGRIDWNGRLDARLHGNLSPQWTVKAQSNVAKDPPNPQNPANPAGGRRATPPREDSAGTECPARS